MARSEIVAILRRADALAMEIENFVPTNGRSVQFRADLAGLLVVSMAASYETCVKETLVNYSARHHSQFAYFTQSHFGKLNSKISIGDLYKYASTFNPTVHFKFGHLMKTRQKQILQRVGNDCHNSYNQILSWRHAFAHSGARNTTIEEALKTHLLAKRVLYAFDDAFL